VRTYRDLTETDLSGVATQVAAQRRRVAERLDQVRHVVAVASGKGGVGKSFVATGVARELAKRGLEVGLLDADIGSPTVPHLLEVTRPSLAPVEGAAPPAVAAHGLRVFSVEFLVKPGEPVRWRGPAGDAFVWRGTLEAGVLREMLANVAWGDLDLLLVDLPPGVGGLADLQSFVERLDGILAITIPSLESLGSVRRMLTLAREQGVPILGVVENMSGHACSHCGRTEPLFEGDAGSRLVAEFDLDLVARLPFSPAPAALAELAGSLARRLSLP